MYATLGLLLIGLIPQNARKLDEAAGKAALEQAKVCTEATKNYDADRLIDTVIPSVLAQAGGRDALLKVLKDGMRDMKGKGFVFQDSQASPPTALVHTKTTCYCLLPTRTVIVRGDTKLTVRSNLLGVSADDGKTWKFIDTEPGEKTIRKLLPDLPGDLKIPARIKPTRETIKP